MQQDAALTQHYERLGRFIYGFQRHTDPDAVSEAAFSVILAEAQDFAREIGWQYGIPTT